jgi:GxxExxY protein
MNADNHSRMNADHREFLESLTERVLAATFEISNTLGAGFLETVYERALLRELGLRGIHALAQASFAISCKGNTLENTSPTSSSKTKR